MLIVASLSLTACGVAPPIQVAQPSPRPSSTAVADSSPETTTTAQATTATEPVELPATEAATAAPTDEAAAEATSPAGNTTLDTGTNAATGEMVAVLNERRSQNNCPALTVDERLQAAAQSHAEDIADRRRIDHLSADGTTLEQRLERAEYPFQRRAEILSLGLGISPITVVDQWLSEPEGGEHRDAILDCDYRDVGVGLGTTKHNIAFWVVDFGQQKP